MHHKHIHFIQLSIFIEIRHTQYRHGVRNCIPICASDLTPSFSCLILLPVSRASSQTLSFRSSPLFRHTGTFTCIPTVTRYFLSHHPPTQHSTAHPCSASLVHITLDPLVPLLVLLVLFSGIYFRPNRLACDPLANGWKPESGDIGVLFQHFGFDA